MGPTISKKRRSASDLEIFAKMDLTHGPSDKYNIVYIACFVMGACSLTSYNAYITAVDYLVLLFPGTDVETLVTISIFLPNLIGLILCVLFARFFSLWQRLIFGFICIALALAGTLALIVEVTDDKAASWEDNRKYGLIFLLGAAALIGFATAVFQGCVFGFTALLPAKYTTAAMGGNGFGGVAISLCRVVTKLAYAEPTFADQRKSSAAYFGIASGIVVASMIYFRFASKRPFARYHIMKESMITIRRDSLSSQDSHFEPLIHNESVNAATAEPLTETQRTLAVVKAVMGPALQVFLTFACTIGVFPGIVVKIASFYSDPQNWFPIIMITIFNCGDMIGRMAPLKIQILNPKSLWVAVIFRFLLFVPLFILLAKFKSFGDSGHNAIAIVTMVLFALSNGYCSSMAMAFGPPLVPMEQRALAGTYMVMCLTIGLATGSLLALPFGLITN